MDGFIIDNSLSIKALTSNQSNMIPQ